MLAIKFGNILRMTRKSKGFSQEKLALDSDLDRTYISLLERGQRMPTIDTVFKLAKALDINASKLVEELENTDL